MGVYTNAVQQLYVAYFGRPADTAGLAYWEGVVTKANGDTSAVSAAFAASAEYKAAYAGLDPQHIVAQVYENLFGHPADLPGLNYWTQALLAGQMTVDNVVTEIAKGAQGNSDGAILSNKVAAAAAFTAALDTTAEVLAYSGDNANAAAKNFVAGVTDDASLKAAIDPTALNNTVAGIVDAGNTGKTFTLTLGQDIITGTAGNDVITATNFNPTTGETGVANLSSIDSIDGGAGKDTLNLNLTGGANSLTGVSIKNVEIINVTGSTGSLDASAFQGATNINLDATSTPNIAHVGAGTVVGLSGSTGAITVGSDALAAAVALTNVAESATLTVAGVNLNSVTVSGTRADTDKSGSLATQALTISAGKDVQTLTLNTNQKTSLTIDQTTYGSSKFVTTLDASASTGGLTISGDANLANIKTGTGNDTVTVTATTAAATSSAAAVNATVSTGDGNDTITVSSTGDGLTSVDAGAGNDKITVNKGAGAVSVMGGAGNDTITIVGTLTTSDVVNGGDGSDTIKLGGASTRTADDYIVFNKLVTGFETIAFSSAETGLDASKLAATYTGIDLATGSAITGVGSQAITAHGDVGLTAVGFKDNADVTKITYAGTIGASDDASGTVTANASVLNLTVKATTVNTDVVLAGHVQTANITVTNSVNASSNATADTFASVTIDNTSANQALKSLTLTGNGSAIVTNADGTALVNVDASGLGGTLTLGDNAGKATGGLTYTSANTAAETIKLGSGIDHISLNASTYDATDTVTGLKLALDSDGNLTADSDVLNVAGVSSVVAADAKFTTKQTDIDLALKDAAQATETKGATLVFQLGGDTYVFHDDGNHVINSADTVVKLTGTIDLDALVASLNHGLV